LEHLQARRQSRPAQAEMGRSRIEEQQQCISVNRAYETKPVVLAPISEILVAYWKSDRWMLLILVVVLLSSVASVGAPYFFARLVDRLS
jgi:hypothetical protein